MAVCSRQMACTVIQIAARIHTLITRTAAPFTSNSHDLHIPPGPLPVRLPGTENEDRPRGGARRALVKRAGRAVGSRLSDMIEGGTSRHSKRKSQPERAAQGGSGALSKQVGANRMVQVAIGLEAVARRPGICEAWVVQGR